MDYGICSKGTEYVESCVIVGETVLADKVELAFCEEILITICGIKMKTCLVSIIVCIFMFVCQCSCVAAEINPHMAATI